MEGGAAVDGSAVDGLRGVEVIWLAAVGMC